MYPRLVIDPKKLTANVNTLKRQADGARLTLMGVTKVACAHPAVVEAMIQGGVDYLADSRVENLEKMAGAPVPRVLLRLPALSEVDAVVKSADISLNSELKTIRALGQAALARGKSHGVVLMVDLGDLREGILPGDLVDLAEMVLATPGIDLVGIGVNLTCYGGVIPEEENLGELAALADTIEGRFDIHLDIVSGGNSSSVYLLGDNRLPDKINNLRLGEILVLGRETMAGERYPKTHDDVFVLEAELIEVKTKGSVPTGTIGMDAFGNKPVFEDRGQRRRGILAIGRQDVVPSGLTALASGIDIIGASSDHLIVDLTDAERDYAVGDVLRFTLDYGALLALMTSPYVKKTLAP